MYVYVRVCCSTDRPAYGAPFGMQYQWTTPFDDKPVADTWDVNHHVALTLCKSYGETYGVERTGKLIPDPDYPIADTPATVTE